MQKNNVIFTGLFIVSAMILPFSPAYGKTVSVNGQAPESITKVKISTNSLNRFQPNAVMMWTEKRKESV